MAWHRLVHYNDVIMSTLASQITSVSIVYSTVCSGARQRKPQSSASLAFVRGIQRWIPRAKGQQRGICFHLMTSSWLEQLAVGEVMIKLCFLFSYGTRTCRLRAHAVSSVYIQFPERNIPRAISQVDVIIHTSMPVGNRTLTVHDGLIKLIPCQYHYANRVAWPFRNTYIIIHYQLESII